MNDAPAFKVAGEALECNCSKFNSVHGVGIYLWIIIECLVLSFWKRFPCLEIVKKTCHKTGYYHFMNIQHILAYTGSFCDVVAKFKDDLSKFVSCTHFVWETFHFSVTRLFKYVNNNSKFSLIRCKSSIKTRRILNYGNR